MSLRDDLIPIVDEIRADIVDTEVGLRLHGVSRVARTWTGTQRGAGSPSDATTVLAPVPRVRPPHPRLVAAAPGKYE